MSATASTGHSALDIGKDGLTFETGRSQSISCELGSKDRFDLGRAGAPDPSQSFRLTGSAMTLQRLLTVNLNLRTHGFGHMAITTKLA